MSVSFTADMKKKKTTKQKQEGEVQQWVKEMLIWLGDNKCVDSEIYSHSSDLVNSFNKRNFKSVVMHM